MRDLCSKIVDSNMITLSSYLIESQNLPAKIFIIIKPGFFKYSKEILERFSEDGWEIEKSKTKQLLIKEAKSLYKIHKKEDWYKPLCEYMSSEPTTAFILVNNDKNMSPSIFDEVGGIKNELREKYSESDMRNVMHSSDSLERMKHEESIYFVV